MDLVNFLLNYITLRIVVLNTSSFTNTRKKSQKVVYQVILLAICKGDAFRSKNQEIINQEEDRQHYLYAEMLHTVGTDDFLETNTLNSLHKYYVTDNNRFLSRFSCQSNNDLRLCLRQYCTMQ